MKSWSLFAGKFFGVEFRIHMSFLFLLAFVLLYESSRSGVWGVVRGLALAAIVLASVMAHELGHIWIESRNGRTIRGTMLLPTGGIAMADPHALDENARNIAREAKIAAAGPLVSALIAIIAGGVGLAVGPVSRMWTLPLVTIDDLVRSFFWINAALCAFNLLPAFPLDAGRVFRAWRAQKLELRQATRQAVNLGNLFAAALMMAGLVFSQWLMLVGLVMFMAGQLEERTVMFQSVVEAVHMEDIMLTQFSTLSPADTLEDALNLAVHCLQDDFPVVGGSGLVGVITRQTIVERLRREGNGYVQGAMSKAFEIASRGESLGSAFRKLTSRGLTLIPVVDEERLVGIVTLQNLMHSMGLLAESRRLRRQMEEQM
ncbi:MAG: CBS domain-containing protein [Acidobacteriia bacterium]|nr:CBS domain-containing protein [Terriglobia bacterium]